MRSIGLQELLVIFGTLLLASVPVMATGLLVYVIIKRQLRRISLFTHPCRHCGHHIPEIGSYCPICGQKVN